eukprot:ANDGO_07801.mRNA.1 Ras-related protein Rab-32A
MTRVFFKEALGALVVYDITSMASLEGAKFWKNEIDEKVSFNGTPIPCLLLANKVDLPAATHISSPEIDSWIRESNFAARIETSAKTGLNVELSMQSLVEEIVKMTSAAGHFAHSPTPTMGTVHLTQSIADPARTRASSSSSSSSSTSMSMGAASTSKKRKACCTS